MEMMATNSPGQIAFEAYSQAVGGKTYDGKSIPHWENLSPEVKRGWDAAAQAVIDGRYVAIIGGGYVSNKPDQGEELTFFVSTK